jgi:hypothetical protein
MTTSLGYYAKMTHNTALRRHDSSDEVITGSWTDAGLAQEERATLNADDETA